MRHFLSKWWGSVWISEENCYDDYEQELDEVFGKTNTESNDEFLRLIFLGILFSPKSKVFYDIYSETKKNDEFSVGDAVFFAYYKQKNRLEHAYSVTVRALSLQLDIWAYCMERLSIENAKLRKMLGEVVSQLHYPPCPNKNWWAKVLMRLLIFFGKNLNISPKELARTAIAQVALKMIMQICINLFSGTIHILFPLLKDTLTEAMNVTAIVDIKMKNLNTAFPKTLEHIPFFQMKPI